MLLVVTSGLLLRSMREILTAETHYRSGGVLTIAMDFSTAGFSSPEEGQLMFEELKRELGSLPGVVNVGFVSYLPMDRGMMTGGVYRPPWPEEGIPEHVANVGWRVVDEDYFRVMGIPLRKGRFFSAEDVADSPPVIVLNEAVDRKLFPDGDALGSPVGFAPFWQDTELEVVGVVAEARDWRVPQGEQPEGYVFMAQKPDYARYMTAVLGTDEDPASLIGPARERLRALVPAVPGTFRTLESLLADSYRDRSFTLGVLAMFALLALFISAVGIYGVVSYTVSAQAREIGIRLALGAAIGNLRSRIFLRSARPVVAGLAAGVGLALAGGKLLESILYEVSPRDPMALTIAPLVLLGASALAIALPVLRHTRIDPASTMREE
jgi:predicted permease